MSEHDAGRCLDSLIAEKVFNMAVKDGWIFENRPGPCPDNRPGCAVIHYEQVPVRPKHYSTSISDAWLVVEKLRVNSSVSLVWNKHHNLWFCDFWDLDAVGEGETQELAICRAALKD